LDLVGFHVYHTNVNTDPLGFYPITEHGEGEEQGTDVLWNFSELHISEGLFVKGKTNGS